MNYNTLRTSIAAAINTPANPRISGAILQQQLIGIVNALDLGALYLGMASTNTVPSTEANGFYFATTEGTYTNFLNSGATAITVSNGEIALLVRSGNAWAKEHMMTMPYIDPTTKHWIVDGRDSGVVAEGQEGQNAYVHIMYAAAMPDSNDDMHAQFVIGDKYIGICSDNNATAPATYTSYQWARFVGASGGGGLTAEERDAIVALFRACVYTTDTGINNLIGIIENATSKTLTGISVAWVGGSQPTVFAGQNIDDLKQYLIVTASYDDNTSATVTNYTLTGDISTAGQATITVNYTEGGITETESLTVTVSVAPTIYSVDTSGLVNCSSNGASTAYEGTTYRATIIPNTGYSITDVIPIIRMDGNDVPGAYSNGEIEITNVTGNIVIQMSAAVLVLDSISATFNPPLGTEFYAGESTNDLKQYLTVTPTWSNGDAHSPTEIAENDYTLSPANLSSGTNTVTVTYGGETYSFTVTAVARPYTINGNEISVGYSTYQDPPYYLEKADRALYRAFDKPIEGGKTYNITSDCTLYPNAYVEVLFYTQETLNIVGNNGKIGAISTSFNNYGGHSGYMQIGTQQQISLPANIVCFRVIYKMDSEGTTAVPSDFRPNLALTEVSSN